MTHQPPVPGDAVSPYPLRKAEATERDDARHELAAKAAANAPDARPTSFGWGRIAAGSAIGSAAIAAAVIFWNRSKAD